MLFTFLVFGTFEEFLGRAHLIQEATIEKVNEQRRLHDKYGYSKYSNLDDPKAGEAALFAQLKECDSDIENTADLGPCPFLAALYKCKFIKQKKGIPLQQLKEAMLHLMGLDMYFADLLGKTALANGDETIDLIKLNEHNTIEDKAIEHDASLFTDSISSGDNWSPVQSLFDKFLSIERKSENFTLPNVISYRKMRIQEAFENGSQFTSRDWNAIHGETLFATRLLGGKYGKEYEISSLHVGDLFLKRVFPLDFQIPLPMSRKEAEFALGFISAQTNS
eukprot:NODE_948_length_2940_cov_0.351989.p1 type:complete len:278 gc:universal NODE_948_length_2940_cov_0.351989:1261-2094(+)